MMECALKIRQISIKDIPEQNINIMKNVLEKMWQNLRFEFDVDCTISNGTVVKFTSTRNNKTVITSHGNRLGN